MSVLIFLKHKFQNVSLGHLRKCKRISGVILNDFSVLFIDKIISLYVRFINKKQLCLFNRNLYHIIHNGFRNRVDNMFYQSF